MVDPVGWYPTRPRDLQHDGQTYSRTAACKCPRLLAGFHHHRPWVGVADGDTVTVLDTTNTQHKICLSGIDAPEKKQPFGQRSKQSLSDLVFDKQVTVETDKKDKCRREVGNVNLEQVTRGFAWHYKAY